MSNYNIELAVKENNSDNERVGKVTVSDGSNTSAITITQASIPIITPSQKGIDIDAFGGDREIVIGSNIDFDIITGVDWIKAGTTTKGFVENTYLFEISANDSRDSRKAEVVLKGKNDEVSEIITITQKGAMEVQGELCIVTVGEAGLLRTILGDEYLHSLTSLKLLGYLNGTDIKCLRQMAGGGEYESSEKGKLLNLDLTEANIVEGGETYYIDSFHEHNVTADNVVGRYMFLGVQLHQIKLPKSATSIEDYAFEDAKELESITIFDNVTKIGSYVFHRCTSLKNITLRECKLKCVK